MKATRYWLPAASLALLAIAAACSAGGSGVTPNGEPNATTANPAVVSAPRLPSPISAEPQAKKKRGKARITLTIPRKKKPGRRLHPEYISPSTQSMTVAIAGQATQTFNFTPSQCSTNPSTGALTCSDTVFLPTGSQTLTISLYDQLNGQGDQLSTASTTVQVAPSAVTPISLTLNGVVASVTVLLGEPASATMNIPEGVATSLPVWVDAYDAKGNLIMAPGNYSSPIPLADSDTSGATSLNVSSVTGPTTDVTLSYNGANLSSATITPTVGGASQPTGAATLTLTAPLMTEYKLSYGRNPYGITSGPDGNLWFTESGGNRIGTITTGGTVTEYDIPTSSSGPEGITSGPNSALWFTELRGDKIGEVTTGGSITEYSIPTAAAFPPSIAAGPDGNLWFTECNADAIGQLTTGGAFNSYPVPTGGAAPYAITKGPDGALWFTEEIAGQIGRVTTAGVVTEYSIPTSSAAPYGITAGPDGALWFAEYAGNNIGRITTSGQITEYSVPTAGARPNYITLGSDNALWFTELDGNKIGRITTAGSITEYSVPSGSSLPNGITSGPDGAIWFTEYNGNKIGRVPTSVATSAIKKRRRI
jgi:virginiamycin B lyase